MLDRVVVTIMVIRVRSGMNQQRSSERTGVAGCLDECPHLDGCML